MFLILGFVFPVLKIPVIHKRTVVWLVIVSGAHRCSPVPMFYSPFVHSLLCFPVPMFPDPIFPSLYNIQSLSSPTRYAICFSVSMVPSPFSPQSQCSPSPFVPSPDISISVFPWIPSVCSPNIFPSPHVPGAYHSPNPFLPRAPILIFPRTVSSAYVMFPEDASAYAP